MDADTARTPAKASHFSPVDARAASVCVDEDAREDERERLVTVPWAVVTQRQRQRAWLVSSLGGVSVLFLLLVFMVVRSSHGPSTSTTASASATRGSWSAELSAFPPDVAQYMDASADPCADLYQFSCGSWVRDTTVPAEKAGIYLSFTTVQDANERALRELVRDDYWPYVGELVASCMDMAAINASGHAPLDHTLRAVAAATSKRELFLLAGQVSRTGPSLLTALGVAADDRDATRYALYASQSGLSLPDPEYYLNPDKWAAIAPAFHTFVETLFVLVGRDAAVAKTDADAVVAFEREVAALFVPKEELKDPTATYNLVAMTDAIDEYPLVIGAFLNGTGIPSKLPPDASLIVETPSFFAAAEQLVSDDSTSLEVLKTVLAYAYVRASASQLSDPFIDAAFALYGQALSGQQQRRERWKVCLSRATAALPGLMGKYFALKRFDHESGELATALVAQIEAAMRRKLQTLEWLDAATRRQALWKLGNVTNLVGHESSMVAAANHLPFVLSPGNFSANMETLAQFDFDRAVARIGQSVDRTEWFMCAAEVNAYYAPSSNQIVFPAGILQPPFFDRRHHPARNFGAIGSVIGHELTHGFDDSGRFYAGDGNLRDWWSNATADEFRTRAACLARQYSAFPTASAFNASKILGYVNGNYTLGENIADNGGLKLSFRAFREFMASGDRLGGEADEREDRSEREDALSTADADKLFFVSFAQAFCAKVSDASMIQRLAVDPHSPEKWRVNGAAMNSADFARAFSCPAGSPMNPHDKCQLW